MSKFKVTMKLQGFELEIEGSREDVPLIAQNLSQQLSGLMGPAGAIIDGESVVSPRTPALASLPVDSANASSVKRKPRKRAINPKGSENGASEDSIDWRHDPAKYGAPQQEWATADKAIWLLYVVKMETSTAELSAIQIAATFNKHFKQAGVIRNFNVKRDLGKLKIGRGTALVGEDASKNPSTWYLTDAGDKKAQELISKALKVE